MGDHLFQPIAPPPTLLPTVLVAIARAQRRAARIRLAWFASALTSCAILLVPAVNYFLNELYASGFYDYLSLFFDQSVAADYWRVLSLSLIESLPSLAILLLSAVVSGFVWSTIRTVRTLPHALSVRVV
jgi:hypothetical protein